MERNKVKKIYKWDLTKFVKDEDDYNKKFKKMVALGKKLTSFKGKLNTKENLRAYFKLDDEFEDLESDLAMYVSNSHNVDLADSTFVEKLNVLSGVLNEISVATSFVLPQLTNLSDEFLQDILNDQSFKNHHFMFKNIIRNKKYVLSEKEEKLLSGTGNFAGEFSEVFDSLTDVDFVFEDATDADGKKHKLTGSNFSVLLQNKDRTLRRTAFENLYKEYGAHKNSIATNYIASVKKDWFFANCRGFKSVLEQKLYPDAVDKKVYTNLLENVKGNVELLHKYYKIKKRITKIEDFCYYDMALDIASESEEKFTYKECLNLAKKALCVLGDEYVQYIDRCENERWVDVFPTKNKRGGAYQTGCYGKSPVILLNFEGKLDDVFTFVHEFGHANHTNFANKYQPRELADYTIMLAEVASTTNEVLLLKYLYNNAKDKAQKIYLLDKYLRMFKSTLFRQTMFSLFEDYAHNLVEQNKPISFEILSKYYGELNKEFHGKAVKHSKQIELEWMRIPHFYSSYYVYKYSTGFVSAINLANGILNDGKKGVENHLKFLSSGGSNYSTEILKNAGIDLKSQKPYNIAFADMKWALDELDKLTK